MNRPSQVGVVVCSALALVVATASVFACESSDDSCGGVIAFSSAHEGNPEIYLMRLDGSGLTRLTHRDTLKS